MIDWPLGKVTYHVIRVEWQVRENLHIHIILIVCLPLSIDQPDQKKNIILNERESIFLIVNNNVDTHVDLRKRNILNPQKGNCENISSL